MGRKETEETQKVGKSRDKGTVRLGWLSEGWLRRSW